MQIRPLHSSWEDACKELWGFGFSNQTTFSVNSDRSLWDICSFQSLHGCDGIHTACVLSCWGTLIELEYSCIFLWHLCRFFFFCPTIFCLWRSMFLFGLLSISYHVRWYLIWLFVRFRSGPPTFLRHTAVVLWVGLFRSCCSMTLERENVIKRGAEKALACATPFVVSVHRLWLLVDDWWCCTLERSRSLHSCSSLPEVELQAKVGITFLTDAKY